MVQMSDNISVKAAVEDARAAAMVQVSDHTSVKAAVEEPMATEISDTYRIRNPGRHDVRETVYVSSGMSEKDKLERLRVARQPLGSTLVTEPHEEYAHIGGSNRSSTEMRGSLNMVRKAAEAFEELGGGSLRR